MADGACLILLEIRFEEFPLTTFRAIAAYTAPNDICTRIEMNGVVLVNHKLAMGLKLKIREIDFLPFVSLR
jgi:hypothetical protein